MRGEERTDAKTIEKYKKRMRGLFRNFALDENRLL